MIPINVILIIIILIFAVGSFIFMVLEKFQMGGTIMFLICPILLWVVAARIAVYPDTIKYEPVKVYTVETQQFAAYYNKIINLTDHKMFVPPDYKVMLLKQHIHGLGINFGDSETLELHDAEGNRIKGESEW